MIDIKKLDLLFHTNLIIKIIIIILLIFSIISWAIIIQRTNIFNIASKELKNFKRKFWSNIELSNLYHDSKLNKNQLTGSQLIFYSGFKEFIRLYNDHKHPLGSVIIGTKRAMNISISNEIEILEKHIPTLGNIGAIAPYIGLLGTVLGIIDSFMSISNNTQQITLQIIAPGIAESLITTAMGLFAAIPAVMAYNKFNNSINVLEKNYHNFKEEFISILHRQVITTND